MIKLCKDCVYFVFAGEQCHREVEKVIDFVHGGQLFHNVYKARSERTMTGSDYCGPSGQFWEAIPNGG